MTEFTARDIKELPDIGDCRVFGDLEAIATGLTALDGENATGKLSFCILENDIGARAIEKSEATIILCQFSATVSLANRKHGRAVLAVSDPRLAFSLAAAAFCSDPAPPAGVHPSALVDRSAVIDPTAHIGPRAIIGPDCAVGAHSVLAAGVILYRDVRIGRDCRVHAGAVLGAPGFGYCRRADGTLVPFPQLGGVRIEDGVEIGANACIDSGALTPTRIGAGTCIDDLVYIAHNATVGRKCLIMAGAIVCGSSQIGDDAELSPGVLVRDQRRIGSEARVGLGAVVTNDVAIGATVAGVPARMMNFRSVDHR